MRKDFSPEEKLLRLIRGTKKKEPSKDSTAGEEIRLAGAANAAADRQTKTTSAVSIQLPFKLSGFNPRILNFILIIFLVGLLLYFVYDLFYSSYGKKEPDIFAEDNIVYKADEKEAAVDKQPYSFYSSSLEGRNIFKPQQAEAKEVISGPTVDEISAGLSLIGIIAGARPQAIIEEKKSGKSYFLYAGGSVSKSKVIEILENSVIMEYQGQSFELVL